MAAGNSRFEPDETIQKALVSTTSRLVGEYVHDDLAIMHAWPFDDIRARTFETPVSRSSFIVAFATPPYSKEAGVVVPDYSPHGEAVAACLSVLFGKRFDMHGLIESVGYYGVPDFTPYAGFCDPAHPFNSHKERTSFPIELNLEQFHRIERMVLGGIDESSTGKRSDMPNATRKLPTSISSLPVRSSQAPGCFGTARRSALHQRISTISEPSNHAFRTGVLSPSGLPENSWA